MILEGVCGHTRRGCCGKRGLFLNSESMKEIIMTESNAWGKDYMKMQCVGEG